VRAICGELLTSLDCAAARYNLELMALLLEAGGMPGDNALYAAIHEVIDCTAMLGIACQAHAIMHQSHPATA
jgi:hypothetical protein